MTKRAFWLGIVATALALPGVGCGGTKSCEELCEASNACPDVTPSETPCKTQCEDQKKLLEASACTAEQQTYDECVSELSNTCDASNRCVSEALTLIDCIGDYCTASGNTELCGGT